VVCPYLTFSRCLNSAAGALHMQGLLGVWPLYNQQDLHYTQLTRRYSWPRPVCRPLLAAVTLACQRHSGHGQA
jgi:hypothetical protein